MPSLIEVDIIARENRDRMILLESVIAQLLANVKVLNWNQLGVNGESYWFGKKAGINGGNLVLGWELKTGVTEPQSDADFETPYGYSQ